MIQARENAEDSESDGAAQLQALQLTRYDTVIGISASGRTPFVVGALGVAELGCKENEALSRLLDWESPQKQKHRISDLATVVTALEFRERNPAGNHCPYCNVVPGPGSEWSSPWQQSMSVILERVRLFYQEL